MIKVGITGQTGFIGTSLYNTLGLYPERFGRIMFRDEFFKNEQKMNEFVRQCDVIVHLAALNRHKDPSVIYETNMNLVRQILNACERTNSKPLILFSSSTQELKDNLYGKSKREGREIFEQWAEKNGSAFTGLVIPNVYGPFGLPFYNSVVATFCYQLTHDEIPTIDVDGSLNLIYVGELVNLILENITAGLNSKAVARYDIPATTVITVSELLRRLRLFRDRYFDNGTVPDLNCSFERNLFNTFLTYIDFKSFFPFRLKKSNDERGSFVETMKLNSGGQISFSTTKPGITRGNHFHTRKAERFAVIKGNAVIEFRRIGTAEKYVFELSGENPSFVDMPVWYTHNITNMGKDDLYTIFWINEHFQQNDPDTFFESV